MDLHPVIFKWHIADDWQSYPGWWHSAQIELSEILNQNQIHDLGMNILKLTNQQIASFQQDGYLVLDFSLDSALLDDIIHTTEPHYQKKENSDSYFHGLRIQDAWRMLPQVRSVALEPRILAALNQLFGRKAFAFQTLNFPTGTEQKIHSDTIHFNSKPAGFMAGAWVALEDVDEQNGALLYYPGSHLLPEVTMQDIGFPPSASHYRDYENYMQQLVKDKQLTPARGVLKKGQVLLWHANLLHGGGSHPDKSRTRHSQVTHYFFEHCQYYTPMLSSPEQIFWRKPFHISAGMPYGDLQSYKFLQPPAVKPGSWLYWQQKLQKLWPF